LLWLPLLTAITVALALGIGLALGVLNVFMRDIGQVVPVALQFLFWLTPVVYMVNIIPVQYRGWLALNPLIPIITGYQDILLYGRAPDLAGLVQSILLAAVLLGLALVLFRKASPEMVDQL
jgi:lipopolysaccharide transport system permease protein